MKHFLPILIFLGFISCDNSTHLKTETNQTITEIRSEKSDSINNHSDSLNTNDTDLKAIKPNNCIINFDSINDTQYNHHVAIYKILNGLHKDTIVPDQLFAMFLYSLYPEENDNHSNLTNRVICDLLSDEDTSNKFYLDSEFQYDDFSYVVSHLKKPKCFKGSHDELIKNINERVIATSDSTKAIKSDIIISLKTKAFTSTGPF